jgi:uncharacterized alpha-E superfamily protein
LQRLQWAASQVRGKLSRENWQALVELQREAMSLETESPDFGELLDFLNRLVMSLAALSGFALDDMTRDEGWRFLMIGRRIERLQFLCTTLAAFLRSDAVFHQDALDGLLELGNSGITYRSRYLLAPILAPVRDLAVLDSYNPRSVAFQVTALNEHIAALPSLKEHGLIEKPQRLAVAMQAMLATAEAEKLEVKTLFALEQDLLSLAEAVGQHYFPHGPNASRPEKLTGLA